MAFKFLLMAANYCKWLSITLNGCKWVYMSGSGAKLIEECRDFQLSRFKVNTI